MMIPSSIISRGVASSPTPPADVEKKTPGVLTAATRNICVDSNNASLSAMIASSSNANKNSLSSLGESVSISLLLGNHAKFGLAERCCYHFDLIETLTSLPMRVVQPQARVRRRERGQSVSSQEGGGAATNRSNSEGTQCNSVTDVKYDGCAKVSSPVSSEKSFATKSHCFCGVVSLLECVPGGSGGVQQERTAKRGLRSKHREFNTIAQVAWGRLKRRGKIGSGNGGSGGGGKRCHQPRYLPLTLSPNTRVSFAYELTSIAILVDASPSLTSTFGTPIMMDDFGGFDEKKISTPAMDDTCCVPLDRLGTLIKTYLQGLVQPIEVPPVSVSGLGIAFGRWKPNLAITVVAAYPPTSKGDPASAGLLVRDYRVTDEASALELACQIERWARREVEGVIAERLCGERKFSAFGDAGREGIPTMSSLGSFSLPNPQKRTYVRSYTKDLLAVGDAALSTLPPEGRPALLIATDCRNVHCGGVFESLSGTSRTDVPISVLDLSSSLSGEHDSSQLDFIGASFSPSSLRISNDSQSLRDMCHLSGGIFLHPSLLDTFVTTTAGSSSFPTLQGDYHFSFKKRSIKPNALQWFTLFTMSPFTPTGSSQSSFRTAMTAPGSSSLFRGSSVLSSSENGVSTASQILGKLVEAPNPTAPPLIYESRKAIGAGFETSQPRERIVFSRYSIQPVRIKSILMTRVVEGYRARRYGHDTQDVNKVSVHLVLNLADCGVAIHYECTFLSSPYHIPTVGQAHIKLELSGDDTDFLQTVKKMFGSNTGSENMMLRGRRVSASFKAAANRICSILRWIRKEDYLESYLCMPGWGSINHFAPGSSFLGRLNSMSRLQRFRHFRSETFEIVTIGPSCYEKNVNIFSDAEQNKGEDEMYSSLAIWSTGVVTDRGSYIKVITPAQDDDLAYYCIIHVTQSSIVSRLYTITVDFHGELNADVRIGVMNSIKQATERANILVLKKCISSYITVRPAIRGHPWSSSWNEYLIHHKCWELLKDAEVLPLISKRRHEIGGFFILNSNPTREVFAKFVQEESADGSERLSSQSSLDVVIYQILSTADGIFVDIHMEASRSRFHPFSMKHSNTPTPFSRIYQVVKSRDIDCAGNVHSRTKLLAVLDDTSRSRDSANLTTKGPTTCLTSDDGLFVKQSSSIGTEQGHDVLRLIKLSTSEKTKLRFFKSEGSGSANEILRRLTTQYITSTSFQTQAAQLSIDENMPILQYSGSWFIMRVDWYVLSIVCLELHDQIQCKAESLLSFRYLYFFTAGIYDLYQSDDDISDAKTVINNAEGGNDHFDLAIIELDHAKNFARACYLGLRDPADPIQSLQNDEVAYALSSLSFEESLQIFISVNDLSAHLNSDAQTVTGTKLCAVIKSMLMTVPGSDEQLFYYCGDEIDSLDESESAFHSVPNNVVDPSLGNSRDLEEEEPNTKYSNIDNPPLFFRFTLDQEVVGFNDLLALKKSTTLAAQVSVFRKESIAWTVNNNIVSKLYFLLSRFSSEQTLEKYRFMGCLLTVEILEEVMLTLPKTNHKTCEIQVEIFISKSNSLITVGDRLEGNSENDLIHGFNVLMKEFDNADFTRASQDSFLFLDDYASREVLPYWCFVEIQPSGITIRVYHPLGDVAAEEQLQVTQRLVKSICHRTNQLLMLESLYKTKRACSLLIEIHKDKEEPIDVGGESNFVRMQMLAPYACPIQHRAAIPLHRRCAPQQAVAELETQILQNFIVPNSNGIFCYKDESENVFYMKLSWSKVPEAEETEQNPHMIELVVHGCDKPGQLITDQLVFLLKRKVLTLTLDALSSLLKKNPRFNLLATDLAFIKGFTSAFSVLGYEEYPASPIRTYSLPSTVLDPLIIILMLRQNICGNTFFQPLNHEHSESFNKSDTVQVLEDNGEVRIRFSSLPNLFQFYFNSSPSQLDPNYQTGDTLTEKGRQYSRKAGSGIAIIEVSLQHGQNSQCEILVGKRGKFSNQKLRVSAAEISLSTCENDADSDQFQIRVEVINTTVDMEVIHKWVELSLSQALAAFSIERHIESSQLGLLQNRGEQCTQCDSLHKFSEQSRLESLNQTLPGLQALEDMMMIANNLPHPAIARVDSNSMLRATVLSNLTLELLEAMLIFITPQKKSSDAVSIMRHTATEGFSLVKITRDNTHRSARVELSGRGKVLRDKPTDSPEFVVVFGLNGESMKYAPQNLFFKHVICPSNASPFSQALSHIKQTKPTLFQRHLAFIVKISRSTRTLMTYNIKPELRSLLEHRFKEIEQSIIKAEDQFRDDLQIRCLQHMSLHTKDSSKQQTAANDATDTAANHEKKLETAESIVKSGPARRIARPTSMLRPTLIGKSIEGAAMQAVTANRLRASARPSITHRQVSGNEQKKKAIAATQREKTIAKPSSVEHKVQGSPKQRRDVASSFQASLFSAYRTFLPHMKDGSGTFFSQHRLNQSSLQNLAHFFLSNEKKNTLLSSRLMCTCYGNFIGIGSIQQLQCDTEMASAKAFVDHLTNQWGTRRIVPVTGTDDPPNNNSFPQLLYLQKTLLSSSSRTALILIEVSMPWDKSRKSFILCCKTWLFNTVDKNSKFSKPFVSLGIMEREAAAIEAVALDFIGRLNLDVELFNFACLRASKMARGISQGSGPTPLPLLKSVIKRYDAESQTHLQFPRYRLQRRFLSPSSFLEGDLLDACKNASIVEHFHSNSKIYDLSCSGSGGDTCFTGKMKVAGFLVYYFIACHESVEAALDVFVLCVTKGKYIDGYIIKDGSPYAERILDVVLYSAMTTVQELVEVAAKTIRKLQIWGSFGQDYPRPLMLGESLIDNINELRTISYRLDLVVIDPRLKDILWDESNQLGLSWRCVLTDMTRSPSFPHCTTFDAEETLNYLVYCKEEDVFIELVLDRLERVQEARILTREPFTYDSDTKEVNAVRSAAFKFTKFVLKWLWSDCENRVMF